MRYNGSLGRITDMELEFLNDVVFKARTSGVVDWDHETYNKVLDCCKTFDDTQRQGQNGYGTKTKDGEGSDDEKTVPPEEHPVLEKVWELIEKYENQAVEAKIQELEEEREERRNRVLSGYDRLDELEKLCERLDDAQVSILVSKVRNAKLRTIGNEQVFARASNFLFCLNELESSYAKKIGEAKSDQDREPEEATPETVDVDESNPSMGLEISEQSRDEETNLGREKDKEELRREEVQRARAMIDSGEDDSEEEAQARKQAKDLLSSYNGTCFTAVQSDDVSALRAFFLVNGSTAMLQTRDSSKHGGNRTLLATAAFWSSYECLEYLLSLGANANVDVNEIDTVYSRMTPLLEAARAGKLRSCKMLLAAGADIKAVDAQGNTCLHWCARRGSGSLLHSLIVVAEKYRPGSTKDLLVQPNEKGKTCRGVARNETVIKLIDKELELELVRMKKRQAAVSRLKRGIVKAKAMGPQTGIKALRRRHEKQLQASKKQHDNPVE